MNLNTKYICDHAGEDEGCKVCGGNVPHECMGRLSSWRCHAVNCDVRCVPIEKKMEIKLPKELFEI